MTDITGKLMSGDNVIATVKNGIITDYNKLLLPLYLKRTKDVEKWLAYRAVDHSRKNARLLKRALRLRTTDDVQTALAVNAATVTDRYWFRPAGSAAVYEDIRFKENYFSELALRGDPDSFSNRPSRTPELTNTANGGCIKAAMKRNTFRNCLSAGSVKSWDCLRRTMSLTDGISAQRISQTARR